MATEETVFIARGELATADRELVTSLLTRLGLDTLFLEKDQDVTVVAKEVGGINLPDINLPVALLPLDGITSRSDFVVKENLEEYRDRFARGSTKQVLGRAFNTMIDSRTSDELAAAMTYDSELGRYTHGEPVHYPGLIVAPREAIGMPQYPVHVQTMLRSKELAAFAIQAGSLVDLGTRLHQQGTTTATHGFIIEFAQHLGSQVD